jgi:hypothetical protein
MSARNVNGVNLHPMQLPDNLPQVGFGRLRGREGERALLKSLCGDHQSPNRVLRESAHRHDLGVLKHVTVPPIIAGATPVRLPCA